MAKVTKFVTSKTGADNQPPVAVLAFTKINALIGAIIQLDGRKSYDPERQPLHYKWRYVQVPVGSEVASYGFTDIRPRGAAVSFIPDRVGQYLVELIVNDGELDSSPVTVVVDVRVTAVPVGEGLVPDAQFLWSYISNFWDLVEDREKITTVWSSVIQLIGSDLIDLWGTDYNKSLDTVQELYQYRWRMFEFETDLTGQFRQRVIVGKTESGTNGRSGAVGEAPGTGTTSSFYLPLGYPGDGDQTDFTALEGNYGSQGRLIVINGDAYAISRTANTNETVHTGADLATVVSTNTATSGDFGDAQDGDLLIIASGTDAQTYRIKGDPSGGTATLVWPSDPPGGPVPSFSGATGLSFRVEREFSSVVLATSDLVDGIIGASWRIPHLLHTPELDLEEAGVSAGDILVFEVARKDTGLSAELRAQVVGCKVDRVGFEFTLDTLSSPTNSGDGASVVENGSIVTVTGLENMRAASVGGHLELTNGDNPGSYEITRYISSTSVEIKNRLASGADSGNPSISWVERRRKGLDVQRSLFRQLMRDLRIVPSQSTDVEVAAAAEVMIRLMPVGVNLFSRPFSRFGLTFKAKKIIHNRRIRVDDDLVSVPVLQEKVYEPPVVLQENLDFWIDGGYLTFASGLFTLTDHAPERLWAESANYDNGDSIERNFGTLVRLSRDDLTERRTRAPYLSAVKGLFFAYTNGPTMDNIRLGLQIFMGLPFAEEKGLILEQQDDFTVDSGGGSLGRLLVEDIDEVSGQRTGFRRVYLYPMSVGLETNPSTGALYAPGDTVARFAPLSRGVSATDYIKDPLWWQRSLVGLEVLKFFTFKIAVDGEVFDINDAQLALDFVKSFKPAYTSVLSQILKALSDDIDVDESLLFNMTLLFYDNNTGLEATRKYSDLNHQGVVLWHMGSLPFATRTMATLRDMETQDLTTVVGVYSAAGWDSDLVRARRTNPGTPIEQPTMEGDLVVIHAGQPGAAALHSTFYEIGTVTDDNNLELRSEAPMTDPETLDTTLLDPSVFEYGDRLDGSIVRRGTNPMLIATDLVTTAGSGLVSSASAKFLTNLVAPGDLLVIEETDNLGEYIIDYVPLTGNSASIVESGGIVTVTFGSAVAFVEMVGRELRVFNGDNPGTYRITAYVDTSNIQIRNSAALGADSGNPSIEWELVPIAPFIEEDQVFLRDLDGNEAALNANASALFRVVRPTMSPIEVYDVQSIYNGTSGDIELFALDPGTGDPKDVFTPGMVGMSVSVSGSENPINDGIFLITEYHHAGKVTIDNPSSVSDATAVATLSFARAP